MEETESIIAGDLVFKYPTGPHLLDVQEHAFELAMRRVQKVSQVSRINIGRVLFGYTDDFDTDLGAKTLTDEKRRNLGDLDPAPTSFLRSIAARFGVPFSLIEGVSRSELEWQLMRDVKQVEDLSPDQIKLNVTALLFRRAFVTPDGVVPSSIRAYFQKDPVSTARITKSHLAEAAIHAQMQLDVSSRITIYFYSKAAHLNRVFEDIILVEGGRMDDLKEESL